MKTKDTNPSWNVWIWSFNHDKLEQYDVVPILVGAIKSLSKSKLPKTRDELSEALRSEAMYYFWSKCEYEMIIHGWPAQKSDEKVDVYDQLCLHWDTFVDWFWTKIYQPQLPKPRKKAVKK